MGGALLNLIASTNSEAQFLTGNPNTSFFYTTFNQYCNFGMQKFRIDYEGNNDLQENTSTEINFNIPRHGDVLNDTYLVVHLPNIWSPIYRDTSGNTTNYYPYEFKWIKNIGCNLVEQISVYADGTKLQSYSGQYLRNMVERDFDNVKKDLFYKMTGNIPDLFDPAKCSNNGKYPNSSTTNSQIINPSIHSRILYIPINVWFCLSTYQSLPLIANQYNNISIKVKLRQIRDLYVVRDLDQVDTHDYSLTSYIKPPATPKYQFKNFINPPKNEYITNTDISEYDNRLPHFNIHLMCTQTFLDENVRYYLAKSEQIYLIKEVRELIINDVVESKKIDIESHGLISSWMWFLQRSDINDRNEWSNYTNLKYENLNMYNNLYTFNLNTSDLSINDVNNTNIYTTPVYSLEDEIEILKNLAILCDGAYRENLLDAGIYNYIEKYIRSPGNGINGLYCYNFTLNTNPFNIQPQGAFNTNFFKTTEFELNTIKPNINAENNVGIVCDPNTGEIISINKSNKQLYEYTYNLTIQEEKYNILQFQNGMVSLKYS